jgi:hypothetical protein
MSRTPNSYSLLAIFVSAWWSIWLHFTIFWRDMAISNAILEVGPGTGRYFFLLASQTMTGRSEGRDRLEKIL